MNAAKSLALLWTACALAAPPADARETLARIDWGTTRVESDGAEISIGKTADGAATIHLRADGASTVRLWALDAPGVTATGSKSRPRMCAALAIDKPEFLVG